jgi:DNA-binding XRE family transcriptional regulator
MTNPITQFREDSHMSRRQFAIQAGISYATLCGIEQGLVIRIHANTLNVLSKHFEKSCEEIQMAYVQWRESLKRVK